MRVGVFGGTFDPIHVGHLIVAETAANELGLDQVLFIPAGYPYLKSGEKVSDAAHRMAMVDLAVESNPRFAASDIEVQRPGPSYTVDTLDQLRDCLGPSAQLFVILGLDSVADMVRWKDPAGIFERASVVGYPRPGAEDPDREALDRIVTGASDRLVLLEGPRVDVSGTDIRRRVARGRSIRYQVLDPVLRYIQDQGLYR